MPALLIENSVLVVVTVAVIPTDSVDELRHYATSF
jgi:hypothetical protein